MPRCLGSLTLVLLLQACCFAVAAPLRVGVWAGPDTAAAGAGAVALERLLAAERCEPVLVTTADLLSAEALDPARLQALVVASDCYPAPGQPVLQRYLAGGGALFTLRGRPFAHLLFPSRGDWYTTDDYGATVRELRPAAWDLSHKGERDELTVSGEGTRQRPWILAMNDLPGYAYASARIEGLGESDGGLAFSACGGMRTSYLCLEANETDGSRWKAIVPLSREWREYRMPLAAFCSYATKDRGQAGDYLHPERLTTLSFGLFRGLGQGAQEFRLREVRLCRTRLSPAELAAAGVALPGRELVERLLGDTVAPGPKTRWPELFSGEFVTGATLMPPAQTPLRGRHDCYLTAPPLPAGGAGRLFPEAALPLRYTPLLAARASAQQKVGDAAALAAWSGGDYAGSLWWSLGATDLDPLADSAVAGLFRRGLARAAAPALWFPEGPRFTAADGQISVSLGAQLAGRNQGRIRTSGVLRCDGRKELRGETEQAVRPRETAQAVWLTTDLRAFDWRRYSVAAEMSAGGATVEGATWEVDARQALRDLCDYLVASGADDGKFSGIYFVDHRGARTLLAAYELFRDRRYLDTALRWGEVMMAEQRPDGGYRMGYGITSRGEECYVADGGEIALGIARLVPYAPPAQRARLLTSLQAYMQYRESFRVPEGGIGVGWCLQDYGKRPVTPLAEPTRVWAPELNTYTIGCTLGAAWAHAALTGSASDRAAAVADGEWLMPRTKSLSGAFVESYVLAHALAPTPELRQRYGDYLQAAFVEKMAGQSGAWWLGGGGRSALNLHGLAYCYEHLGRDPRVLAQMARSLSGIVAKQSPTSIYRLLGRPRLNQEEWIYLCFSGLGIADAVETDVTLRRLTH